MSTDDAYYNGALSKGRKQRHSFPVIMNRKSVPTTL